MQLLNITEFDGSLSKTSIKNFSDAIIQRIENGDANSLNVYVQAKALSEIAKLILDGAKDSALNQIGNYGKGENILGATFTEAKGRVNYDFSDDPKWTELNNSLTVIKTQLSEREKMLKHVTEDVFDADGNILIAQPTVGKIGDTQLRISFPK